jgi:hypothetical protein
MPKIPATWEVEIGGSFSESAQGKAQDPVKIKLKLKRVGGVAQVVEHLSSASPEFKSPCCKSLSSLLRNRS